MVNSENKLVQEVVDNATSAMATGGGRMQNRAEKNPRGAAINRRLAKLKRR